MSGTHPPGPSRSAATPRWAHISTAGRIPSVPYRVVIPIFALVGLLGLAGGCANPVGPSGNLSAASKGTPANAQAQPPTDEDPLTAALRRDAEEIARLQSSGALGAGQRGPGNPAPASPADAKGINWNSPSAPDPSAVARNLSAGSLGSPETLASLQANRSADPGAVVAPVPAGPSPTIVAPPTPPSSSVPGGNRSRDLAVQLSGELYRAAADADMPLPQLMTIAALSLSDPDRPFDPDAFPALTAREREIVAAFHTFCAQMGERLQADEDPEVAAEVAAELHEALRGDPQLSLPRAEFCTRVDVFGKFEVFPERVFLAGSRQQVVIYFEIDNFTSVQDANGEWVTDLSVELTIYTKAGGVPVWRQPWTPAIDRNRNRRRDFFINQLLEIPKSLGVGQYAMKIAVRDEKSGALAEQTIEFTLVADERMVGGR